VLLVYVLYNLFKNALQRSSRPDGGSGDTAGRRQLMITDTGSGIPDDVQPHVFEPFYSTGGTGMIGG
jgi:signal transduction histidine kinase